MAKAKSTYERRTTEKNTVTFYQKKGTSKNSNVKCPVCGKAFGKK